MQRLIAVLAVLLFLCSVLALSTEAAPPPKGAEKAAALKAPKGAKAPAAVDPTKGSGVWWRDPGIQQALSLTDEQRQKMDGFLAAYREKLPQERRPVAFHETLVQGTWKQARAENEKMSERAAAAVRMRGELKVDVLSLLSEKQHQKLVDQYPRLIYKPWMRAMQGNPSR